MILLLVPTAPPGRRMMFLGRCAALLAILLVAQAALAQDSPQSTRRRYDIAAQPLDLALARFSEISRVDVLFRQVNASQRRAPALTGEFTPAEALARLLEGSGLVARFTSAHSAVIVSAERANEPWIAPSGQSGGQALLNLDMMRVTAPRTIGARPRSGHEAFAQQLVVVIRRFVMERAVFEGGKSVEIRIATRISSAGALYDVRVVRGSRDRALDARVVALLEGAALGLVPPSDLRQPLLFDVSGH
jgi:hypothetical protein